MASIPRLTYTVLLASLALGSASARAHPRQLEGIPNKRAADGYSDLDDLVNATLVERYNKPAIGREWSSWVSLGESYAAGPGAGDNYGDGGGGRRQGAYPAQLEVWNAFREGHGSPEFVFAACSASSTTEGGCGGGVLGQTDAIDGNTGLVTLSVGGNDVSYSTVLRNCIFQAGGFNLPQSNPCFQRNFEGTTQQDYFDSISDQVFAADFHTNFFTLAGRIIEKLEWNADKGTVVYQTGYPQFFDDYTTQCSETYFGPFYYAPEDPANDDIILLDTSLRKNFNFLLQQMNCIEAYWIDQINHDNGDSVTGTDIWKHSNMDQRFNSHRFCREGIQEPDRDNTGTWFFNLFSNSESGSASAWNAGDDGEGGTVEQYSDVDANTCDPVASGEGEDEWVTPMRCMFAKALANGHETPLPAGDRRDSSSKIFHPRIDAHWQTKEEVTQAMRYARGASPSGKTLRILSIGDGLTLGTKSADGSGYRKYLFERLEGNDVEFVGSQSSGEQGSKWEKSEGYEGFPVESINDKLVQGGATGTHPNVIVIMAGTEDVNNTPSWDELELARGQFERLLHIARIIAPNAFIIVAHIPAIGTSFDSQISDVQRRAVQWNAHINMVVNREHTVRPENLMLYAHTTPTTSDHVDGDDIYPNDHGYRRLADDIAEAIAVGDSFGWIADPTEGTDEAGSLELKTGTCTAANECTVDGAVRKCFSNSECAPEKTRAGQLQCTCVVALEGTQEETCVVPAGCENAAAPDGCAILCA